MLGEGPTDNKFNDSIDATEKRFNINLSKAKANFCSILY